MNAKKIFIGSLIVSAMFADFSPALADEYDADEVEVFGTDFEEIEDVPIPTKKSDNVVESPQQEVVAADFEEVEDIPIPTRKTDDDVVDEPFQRGTTPARTETVEVNQPTTTSAPRNTTVSTPNYTVTVKNANANSKTTTKQKKLKMQKARFIKLTMDQNFIYYLDKDSVTWKKMPYSTTEMVADVWIRMINRNDNELLHESEVDDIVLAAEEGKQFQPEDVEVLCHQKYHLEHYYLRPKTRQIQYLVELSDIEGNPQNTVNERVYEHQNWENLVPSSIESKIYYGVIKVIGKGKSQDSPTTFADYLEEYARISIR